MKMAEGKAENVSVGSSDQSSAIFDPALLEKVAMYKMQYPDMFVSDFLTDDAGVQPLPDLEKDISAKMLWAAEHGKLDIVKELYAKDPMLILTRDNDMYTPLHRACYNNHADVVKFLLEHGAQLDAKTEDGWQPLHSAARWGAVDAARILIDSGKVNINAVTNGNVTPLHLAVSSTEPQAAETVRLLLSQPFISRDIKDNAGDSPYDIARQTSEAMLELFSHNAKERQ